ncbi:MAG TPA: FAD/NAD(P)-binding oxidoreductase [Allocoleopsis sp.]
MVTSASQQSQIPALSASSTLGKTLHYQIAIVGGGAAGVMTASLLLKKNSALDIAIIEPSNKHYYQPGWTLTGGGVFRSQDTVRNEREVIPQGATWIEDRVVKLGRVIN